MTKVGTSIIGVLIAPLIAAVLAVLLTGIKLRTSPVEILGLTPVFYFYALLTMILLGLPVFFLVHYMKLMSWWASLLAGSLVGAVVAMVLRMPNTVQTNDLLSMASIGAVAALGFWYIWNQGT